MPSPALVCVHIDETALKMRNFPPEELEQLKLNIKNRIALYLKNKRPVICTRFLYKEEEMHWIKPFTRSVIEINTTVWLRSVEKQAQVVMHELHRRHISNSVFEILWWWESACLSWHIKHCIEPDSSVKNRTLKYRLTSEQLKWEISKRQLSYSYFIWFEWYLSNNWLLILKNKSCVF